MKKFVCFLFLAAMVASLEVSALAERRYRFELFGAGNVPVNKDFEIGFPQSTTPIKGTHEFTGCGRGGVRLGVDGSGHFGQDYVYSYGVNPSRIVNHTTGAAFSFTNRIHQASYNALWYPRGLKGGTTFPYLTAGVGATFYTLTQTTVNEALDPNRGGLGKLRNEYIFAFNAGGGLLFRINKIYGFRVDVRDYMTRPPRYGLPKSSSDPNAVVFPVGTIFHQIEASFAFVYYF